MAQEPLWSSKNDPLQIKAEKLEVLGLEGEVVFEGKVVAVQGPFSLRADRLRIKTQGEKQDVKTAWAEGNVRMEKEEITAESGKARYDAEKAFIELTGNAKIWRNRDVLAGERIGLRLDIDSSEIDNAEAVLYVKGESAGGVVVSNGGASANGEPLRVKCDKMFVSGPDGSARFVGNVVAAQGYLKLKSAEAEVHFDPGTKKMNSLKAWGDVQINKDGITASSGAAFYDFEVNTVTLEKNPRVRRDRDCLAGERMTLFLEDNRVVVEGASGVFSPEGASGDHCPK